MTAARKSPLDFSIYFCQKIPEMARVFSFAMFILTVSGCAPVDERKLTLHVLHTRQKVADFQSRIIADAKDASGTIVDQFELYEAVYQENKEIGEVKFLLRFHADGDLSRTFDMRLTDTSSNVSSTFYHFAPPDNDVSLTAAVDSGFANSAGARDILFDLLENLEICERNARDFDCMRLR